MPSGLGFQALQVQLAAETSVEDIIATLSHGEPPRLVIIDSIQTMWTEAVEAAPGTVTQVRGSAQTLIRYAKTSGAAVILVGHVTKDGQIAGPRRRRAHGRCRRIVRGRRRAIISASCAP